MCRSGRGGEGLRHVSWNQTGERHWKQNKNLIKAKWYVNKAEFTCLNCVGLLEHWMIICHLRQVVYGSKYTRKCQKAAIIHTCAVQCWWEVCFRGFNAWKNNQTQTNRHKQVQLLSVWLLQAERRLRWGVNRCLKLCRSAVCLNDSRLQTILRLVCECQRKTSQLVDGVNQNENELFSYVNNGIVFVTI